MSPLGFRLNCQAFRSAAILPERIVREAIHAIAMSVPLFTCKAA